MYDHTMCAPKITELYIKFIQNATLPTENLQY